MVINAQCTHRVVQMAGAFSELPMEVIWLKIKPLLPNYGYEKDFDLYMCNKASKNWHVS